ARIVDREVREGVEGELREVRGDREQAAHVPDRGGARHGRGGGCGVGLSALSSGGTATERQTIGATCPSSSARSSDASSSLGSSCGLSSGTGSSGATDSQGLG